MNPVYLDLTKAFHWYLRGRRLLPVWAHCCATHTAPKLLHVPRSACGKLVWGSEKSPRWGIAWFSCPAVPQHWEMAHKPHRVQIPWVQTQGQREYPEQTLQGSEDRDIEQPEWAKRAWRYIYFWKVFEADCISRALEWITPGILSQGWKFCSVLMAFTLPILLTELLHWTKGNFTACRVCRFWDGILQWE